MRCRRGWAILGASMRDAAMMKATAMSTANSAANAIMAAERNSEEGKFFVVGPDVRGGGRGHGLVIENIEKLLSHPRRVLRPVDGGFPVLPEKPHLVLYEAKGNFPRDLEGGFGGYWLVSEALKQIFESVDPEGFAFMECDFTLADGSRGPQRYLCDITRTLDALDEERSKVKMIVSDEYVNGKYYDLGGKARLVFREELLHGAHAFMTPFSGKNVFCDRIMRDALQSEPLTGVWIPDA